MSNTVVDFGQWLSEHNQSERSLPRCAVLHCTADCDQVLAAGNWLDLIGHDLKLGLSLTEFCSRYVHEEDGAILQQLAGEGKKSCGRVVRLRQQDGRWRPLHTTATTLKPSEEGMPAVLSFAFVETVVDKSVIDDLSLQRRLLELVEKYSRVGHWHVDLQSGSVFWSDEVCRIHGVPPGYHPSLSEGIDFYHPEDRDRVDAYVREAQRKGKPFAFDLRIIRRDGEVRVVRSRGICTTDAEDRATGMFGTFQDVTEDVAHQQQLKATSVLLETILDANHNGYWEWFIAEEVEETSDQFWRLIGYGGEEDAARPSSWRALLDRTTLAQVDEAFADYLRHCTGKSFSVEIPFPHKEGHTVWILRQGKVVDWTPDGAPRRAVGTFTDISDEVENRRKVAWLETRFELASQAAKVGIWEVDPATHQVKWSDHLLPLLGEAPGACDPITRLHPVDRAAFDRFVDRLKMGEGEETLICRFQRTDGTYADIKLTGGRVEKEQYIVFAGTFQDVTESLRTERTKNDLWTTLKSETLDFPQKMRCLLKQASDYLGLETGIISHIDGPNYRVVEAVTTGEAIPQGSLLPFETTYCYHTYNKTEVVAYHKAGETSLQSHPCYQIHGLESYIGCALIVDGVRFGTINFSSHDARGGPFTQPERDLVALLAQWVGYEIGLHQSMEALRESQQRFELAAKGSSVGIWEFKLAQPNEIWCSEHFLENLGLPTYPRELKRTDFHDLIHPNDLEMARSALNNHLEFGQPFSIEYRLRHATKGYQWMMTTGQAQWDECGKPIRVIGSTTNINRRRLMEDEIRKRTKWLEQTNQDLDHFAYIASHDLRAPLRGMDNVAQWIEEDLENGQIDDAKGKLLLLRGRVGRMNRLLTDVLAYSRAGKLDGDPEPVDMGTMLADIATWTTEGTSARVEWGEGLPVIETIPTLIEQIFTNLIGNAIKHHDGTDPTVTVNYLDEGEQHHFIVEDDGPGVPQSVQPRIFKMFQTFGQPGTTEKSSGIGLAIVKKLVESVGGHLWILSPVTDRGSAFHVTLPKVMIQRRSTAEVH
ncbi:nineteen domain light and oxygen sensing his kinase [Parvularcula bermudensis HTCC2503]|uniref:histidine kinase n=1 Tax=Parvularcula bermudensis (strain ATCC BAA-594 / HTCC2503 / KCTC 12087) TaxID=314260 RepID=E0TBC7_PARBH|nr:PAS domain-containing protein [Parvularcula bermudensis]ADM08331.1 nineteen domain light and oxygen sensing his kinase [Parvularcula bermudensis HTCC2503]